MSFVLLVAVAVTIWPAVAVNSGIVALPAPSRGDRRRAEEGLAFAVPDGSQAAFPKNWMVNGAFAVLFNVPSTPPAARVSTGKFCRLFAPVSASPASFGVIPPGPISMPRLPVGEDGVLEHRVTGPGVHANAGEPVVGDDIVGAGRGSADGRARAVQEHPMAAVRQWANGAGVHADAVTLDAASRSRPSLR